MRERKQRVRPTAAPSPDPNAGRIDVRLSLQPFDCRLQITQLNASPKLTPDALFKFLSDSGRAAIVTGQNKEPLVQQDLLIENGLCPVIGIPLIRDRRRTGTTVHVDNHGILL